MDVTGKVITIYGGHRIVFWRNKGGSKSHAIRKGNPISTCGTKIIEGEETDGNDACSRCVYSLRSSPWTRVDGERPWP